jgi:predicted amino acid racemase
LLASGGMPKEINQIRIGETILLGRNVLDRSPWPNTRQDTFRIVSQIVEMEKKPSIPVGDRGQDAFGGLPEFVDRGIRTRVICNIGRQDIVVDNLEPEDPGIRILGGSSDHLILDVEESTKKIGLGDEIAFNPGYAALLSASTSSYVRKTIREG